MYNIDVYNHGVPGKEAKIRRLTGKRDWMHPMTYNCYPVSFANTFGYGVYFEEDVSFIWNGDRNTPAEAVKGGDHIWSGRGEGTVSFVTNLLFRSEENVSLLTMPVPNEFNPDATCISTIVSTSFLTTDFSVVWKVHTPNKEIIVPAGTNIACILPLSIGDFQDSTITMKNGEWPYGFVNNEAEYVTELKKQLADGKNPRFYKKAINHKGEKIGKHEVEHLNMTVIKEKGKDNG